MALWNTRSLLWRGEDLGYGSGNTRELVSATRVAASARPLILSQGFVGSQVVTGYLGTTPILTYDGKLRMVMNRSPDYWLTLSAQCSGVSGATGSSAIQIPIPPLGSVYLPNTVYGPATLSVNSTWPIPVPPSGVTNSAVPLASSSTTVTFDFLGEG